MRLVASCVVRAGVALSVVMSLLPGSVHGEGPPSTEVVSQSYSEVQGENLRESEIMVVPPGGEEPLISFIDSPTVACYQPDAAQDICHINWYYKSVSADPSYIISMTTTINQLGKVARYAGFFQTSMYVPFAMHDRGFKVACGALGSGGNPDLGQAYAWQINARDSAGLESNNYGTVYCPAFTP